jgi:anti-sigma factor RsiW
MTCTDISPLLDDYVDGDLPPDAVARVTSHLAGCARCRAEMAGIQALLADARALPRTVEPPRELWAGIESRLSRRVGPAPHPVLPRTVLALAAGLALLVTGALLATWYQRRAAPAASDFALVQRRYAQATAELARTLTSEPSRLPSDTRAVVARNLAIVDQAIKEAETALATDPGNAELEQMVIARYAQRLALLKRATEAGKQES